MRVPKESLDDFAIKANKRRTAPPPHKRSPRLSGETEVLKPLTRWEDLVRARAANRRKLRWPSMSRLSSYHRTLTAGGAGVVMVFVLGMSIYFGIGAQPVEQAASPIDLHTNR